MERLFNLAGSIVALAVVATVLQSQHTADVIRAATEGFSSSIKAARG